jgi:fatty-acyl-CoA synthase
LIRAWQERGISIHQGYGMTEAAPLVTYLPAEHARAKAGTAGIAALFTEMRLVGSDGQVVQAPHMPGEVEVRGPNVFKGYWNRPEATAVAFKEGGWFATGDVAYLDEDGFLTVSDRLKDIIISGGENIAPAEVESALLSHGHVGEVAVIGVPDPKWGEVVKAFIVARGTALTLEELRTHAEGSLARFKLPRVIEIVDALPRNALGKVLKHELRRRENKQS